MPRDIESRADIDNLLGEFYKIAIHDPQIGHHFAGLDLGHHLPIIGDFWQKILFGDPVYFNNPLAVHQRLHERFPLATSHFDRWVAIFRETVDRMFAGPAAETAKTRAGMIAYNLNQRLNGGAQIARG